MLLLPQAHAPPALPASAPADEATYAEASVHIDTFLQSLENLDQPLFTDRGDPTSPRICIRTTMSALCLAYLALLTSLVLICCVWGLCPFATYGLNACVARPVSRKEMAVEPDSVKVADSEWKRLWDKHV